jgi:MFS family permease
VLVVLVVHQAGLTFVRVGLPVMAPFIRADLGLSLAETGLLVGAFDVGALIAYFATGRQTAIRGERSVMVWGALVTGLSMALAAVCPPRWLLGALVLAGLGFPSSQVGGSHGVATRFGAKERGLAMSIRMIGFPLGGLAAAAALSRLSAGGGWRRGALLDAFVCAGTLVVCVLVLGKPGATEDHRTGDARPVSPTFLGELRSFARDRRLVATTVIAGLLAMSQFSLLTFFPLFVAQTLGWELPRAVQTLLWVHVGSVAARPAWGWLSDRVHRQNRGRSLVPLALSGAAVLGLIASMGGNETSDPSIVAALAGLTLLGWNGLYVTLLADIAGPRLPTMLAISLMLCYVVTSASPPLFGAVVERTHDYRVGWAMLGAAQLLAALGAWRLANGIRVRDNRTLDG